MRILVTGATGTLGRPLVDELRARGHEVRALSRRPHEPQAGVAWFTDLPAAAGGLDVVVHAASNTRRAGRGDVEMARDLLHAAGDAHVVFVSIVGVDRLPMPYYKVKLAVEELVAGAAGHWTILRATQFHDLVRAIADRLARSPVVPYFARTGVQPVAVEDVAVRVAELAEAPPEQGRAPDFGGPEVWPMGELFRAYLRSRGQRRLLVPVWIPGRLGRGLRAGYGMCPDHADGTVPFVS
jgi:uncharacterized protein YbjT (DUF2867 family)